MWNLSSYAQRLHDKSKWLGIVDCQHPHTTLSWCTLIGVNKDGGMLETY